ncbi:MAG: histidine kinase [Pseudomonadota bacterium]|jgi:signal transduction histidine kinase
METRASLSTRPPAYRANPLSHVTHPVSFLLTGIVWSLLVLFSLWTQREQLNRTAQELARIDAIANLKKDMAIRKWASEVGGVFIKEDLAPNVDALSEQERVIAIRLTTGESFKQISLTPIHILLGIQEVSNKEYGSKERLTSLQLLNRNNAPDEWEAQALKTLQGGSEIVAEAMPRSKGHGLMRVMIPMRMDEECLECHRETLVPVGGLRGGAAVTIDLNTYWTAQEPTWRTIQYWHTGIWLAGMATLLAYWIFLRRRAAEHVLIDAERRDNEVVLQKHKQRLEESEARLRELAAFLQTVREEERTRIARELHDELGQALTALRFDLGWLRGKCSSDDKLGSPAAERVGAALGVVEQSIVSLRRISEDLRPAMLDSLGLAAALEHHVAQFTQRTGVPCDLRMNREEFDLAGNLATTVFRIVQEALTNVARHAEASAVTVEIEEAAGGIRLSVTDNGKGCAAPTGKKTFGVLGMRERAAILGGTLDIDSRPGAGTRIAGWLPFPKDSTP